MNIDESKQPPRTSSTDPLQVHFINQDGLDLRGRIGLTFAPGKKQKGAQTGDWDRDLVADLSALRKQYRTDVLVSLIEDHEFINLQIPTLRDEAPKFGIEVIWFPIRDQSVPASIADLYAVVQSIAATLREGKTVVIHCMGGLGRTGLVAASVLIAMTTITPEDAISTVRRARPGAVENLEQEKFIHLFHRHIHSQ